MAAGAGARRGRGEGSAPRRGGGSPSGRPGPWGWRKEGQGSHGRCGNQRESGRCVRAGCFVRALCAQEAQRCAERGRRRLRRVWREAGRVAAAACCGPRLVLTLMVFKLSARSMLGGGFPSTRVESTLKRSSEEKAYTPVSITSLTSDSCRSDGGAPPSTHSLGRAPARHARSIKARRLICMACAQRRARGATEQADQLYAQVSQCSGASPSFRHQPPPPRSPWLAPATRA